MLCASAGAFFLFLLIPEFQGLTTRADALGRFGAFGQPGIVVPLNLLAWKGGASHV